MSKRTFKATITHSEVEKIPEMKLEDFVTQKSLNFFKILELDESFLLKNISVWETDPSYISSKKICKMLIVVNDAAERGVSLIQEYNSRHTKNEEELQSLLQVVQENRKELSKLNKSNVSKYLSPL